MIANALPLLYQIVFVPVKSKICPYAGLPILSPLAIQLHQNHVVADAAHPGPVDDAALPVLLQKPQHPAGPALPSFLPSQMLTTSFRRISEKLMPSPPASIL